MTNTPFWKLDHCSNEELLAGLQAIIRSCRQRSTGPTQQNASMPSPAPVHNPQSAPARKLAPAIEPLSEARYKVQLTASASLKAKLDQARDLMRHRNPSGDLAVVVERALDALLEQIMKERFGATEKPKASKQGSSARVTNAARREVCARDGLQCSWIDAEGRRCESRGWLELDHEQPRGQGGGAEAGNIRILCRGHNSLAAEQVYGRGKIERSIARRRQATQRSGDAATGVVQPP